MTVIISAQRDCVFRISDVEFVFHIRNKETNQLTNEVSINFKSGNQGRILFKDVDEAKDFINMIIKDMKDA